ncbi:MAG: hypothetical protein IJM54_12140 [Thermoguttaceae bacterium]|nr:hypothetical protein [Thermoguttaceae bacterium]
MTSTSGENENQNDAVETSRRAEEILTRAGKEALDESTKPRPFWRKKRYWLPAIFLVVVYFCYLRPVEITRETVEALQLDATVDGTSSTDFRRRFNEIQNEEFAPPEENGFRVLLHALGPRALNQNELADSIDWDDFPTNERSKDWFNDEWTPLCRKFQIDPAERPVFLNQRGVRETLEESEFQQICTRPWGETEFPEAARWLEANQSYYATLEEAIEKPKFGSWFLIDDKPGTWIRTSGPDFAIYDELALLFALRANYRIGGDDFEGALDDRRRIFRLARFLLDRREPYAPCEIMGLYLINVGLTNVDFSKVPAFEQNQTLLARNENICREAFETLDVDASFQRATTAERNAFFALSVDYIATVESRTAFAKHMFYDFNEERAAQNESCLTLFIIKLAQFSSIGLDANVFLRKLDEYWQNPDLINQLPEGDLAFLAGLCSPCRKTRSEYFAGCYALAFLPSLEETRRLLEQTKNAIQKRRRPADAGSSNN